MTRIALLLSASLLVVACQPSVETADNHTETTSQAQPAPATISDAAARFEDGAYVLNWSFEADAAPVSIEVTTDPEATRGELIAEAVKDTQFSWSPDGDVDERHYYLIRSGDGKPVMTATRLLPLEGGRNFRDLGGYETANGQTIAWGQLYRSGVMEGLTEDDYEYLSELDIKVVCDLRSAMERQAEPTDWKAGEAEYLYFPDPSSDPASGFGQVFRDPDLTPEKVAKAFGDGYFNIAHEQAPAYTMMFDKLAAGEAPLAFNCSAGKDRTGIGAALILTALGVPRDTIIEDYALSDDYVDYMAEFLDEESRQKAEEEGSPYAFLFQLPPEVISPMMESRPEYLQSFFADIEAEYGSVEAFLKEKVDVTEGELVAMRQRYLRS